MGHLWISAIGYEPHPLTIELILSNNLSNCRASGHWGRAARYWRHRESMVLSKGSCSFLMLVGIRLLPKRWPIWIPGKLRWQKKCPNTIPGFPIHYSGVWTRLLKVRGGSPQLPRFHDSISPSSVVYMTWAGIKGPYPSQPLSLRSRSSFSFRPHLLALPPQCVLHIATKGIFFSHPSSSYITFFFSIPKTQKVISASDLCKQCSLSRGHSLLPLPTPPLLELASYLSLTLMWP